MLLLILLFVVFCDAIAAILVIFNKFVADLAVSLLLVASCVIVASSVIVASRVIVPLL